MWSGQCGVANACWTTLCSTSSSFFSSRELSPAEQGSAVTVLGFTGELKRMARALRLSRLTLVPVLTVLGLWGT